MPLIISTSDQAVIENIKNDARQQNSEGISVDSDADGNGNTAFAAQAVPVRDFELLSPNGSATDNKLQDMLRATFVPVIRRIGPFQFQALTNTPSFAFTTATTLLTGSIPAADRLAVARNVFVAADFSAYSSSANTSIDFWVEVNGIPSTHFKYFFNESGSHRCISAKWLVNMPARTSTVVLKAQRGAGAGTLTLNADDFVSISVWG